MSPATRRVWLYWLLLLLPTLAAGAGALQLLRREQARIAEQGAQAAEARMAAAAGRVRLIVENVELLAGDVQEGLLDALEAQPPEVLTEFLDTWERENPLVRTVFVARDDGSLLRPSGEDLPPEQRGFARRLSATLREQPPWREASPPADLAASSPEFNDEEIARQEISANVAQVQSARRGVQELLKSRRTASSSPTAKTLTESPAPAPSSSYASRDAIGAEMERARRAEEAKAELAQREQASVAAAPARRGWTAREINGRRHVFGWVQSRIGGTVRGVELDLSALVMRLGEALPRELGAGEGYVLRDEAERTVQQTGAVPREGDVSLRVPIASPLLSGWSVAAFLAPPVYGSSDGAAFFGVGAVLVAILAMAILAGGFLLLQHARRSEREAAQKTSFVANVSHEFKTPLTTIRLYAELLEQGRVRDAVQGGEYLRTIGRETQRLARMVNNALDFSRLEQGKKSFVRQPVDLTDALARLLATHAPRLHDAGLRGDAQLPSAAVMVNTDRDAVEQIVLNLLDNACKYASGGGEVTITLTAGHSGGAEVRVSDRGPGVPPDHRERVFEKFHRVDDALTAEKSGAGLGLSIARQLARGLGGELRYSDRAGGGAEFVLELP